MHTHTSTRTATHFGARYSTVGRVASIGVLLLTAVVTGQPERTADLKPRDRAAQRERVQHEINRRVTDRHADAQPEVFRVRLVSMLEQLEASAERLRGAIETLDAGGSVDDAIQQLGGPMRARRLAEMWTQWGRPGMSDRPMYQGADNRPPSRGPGNGMTDQARGPWGGRDVSSEEIFAFLHERAPQLAERLDRLRKEDPQRVEGFVARLRPRIAEILSTRAHDPELAELLARDFRIGMLVSEVGGAYARALAAGAEERAAELQAELRAFAAEQVDLRLARREHEIARLAARLAALQAEVEAQRNKREELIAEVIERAGRGTPPERPGRGHRRGSPKDE